MTRKQQQDLQQEINEFIETWDCKQMVEFLRDVMPLVDLYDVDSGADWVSETLGGDDEDTRTVRLVRTAYLVSRLSEFHTGRLLQVASKYKGLWKRIEKQAIDEVDVCKTV